MTERDTIARAAASLDDPDAVVPDRHDHAPDRIWLRYDGTVTADDQRPWETNPYTRADLIPAMLQDARNGAVREMLSLVDEFTEDVGDGITYLGASPEFLRERIEALIDTPAPPPAEPAGDALREALGWYAEQFCELGRSHECCGRMGEFHCSGCRARAALAAAPTHIHRSHDMTDNLRDDLTRDLNALRAAASRGAVTSREIFQMTDGMMDRLSRAALAAAPAPQPACCLCDDRPQAPNDPCGACGKTTPQPETLAWAVIDDDGMPSLVNYDRLTAVHLAGHGEHVVRVSIRVVEDKA